VLNKPYGVISQFTPEPGTTHPTLAGFGLPGNVYPVGRLDHDSEGLLLLSDDRRLTSRILDPVYGHTRTYLAQVENIPDDGALLRLCHGVIVRGHRTRPASAERLDHEPHVPPRLVPVRFRKSIPTSWIEITLSEGRNRQVRRMTAAVGHPTLRLIRVCIGSLDLRMLDLPSGSWRDLSVEELRLVLLPHR